jgi:hypothetical protein
MKRQIKDQLAVIKDKTNECQWHLENANMYLARFTIDKNLLAFRYSIYASIYACRSLTHVVSNYCSIKVPDLVNQISNKSSNEIAQVIGKFRNVLLKEGAVDLVFELTSNIENGTIVSVSFLPGLSAEDSLISS